MSRRPPLDDDDLLEEILIRLPPLPSSLLCASLVCKRWRIILTDPQFLGRFRKHHMKSRLLDFFTGPVGTTNDFIAVLDDRTPLTRFIPPDYLSYNNKHTYFMGCHNGHVVLLHPPRREIGIWDPITGQQQQSVPFPPGLDHNKRRAAWFWHALVMCASEYGHMHVDCFSSPFKLAFIWVVRSMQVFACVYESTSGLWGDTVSLSSTYVLYYPGPNVLVRNAICQLLPDAILTFDFERQNFAMIEEPIDANITTYRYVQLLRTEGGQLGLAVLSYLTIKLWERKSNSDGVDRWLLMHKTIQLELFPCTMLPECKRVHIEGYDEDSNVIFLDTNIGKFMLQLDSMRYRQIIERDTICYRTFCPYISYYTAVTPSECLEGLGSKKGVPSCSTLIAKNQS